MYLKNPSYFFVRRILCINMSINEAKTDYPYKNLFIVKDGSTLVLDILSRFGKEQRKDR